MTHSASPLGQAQEAASTSSGGCSGQARPATLSFVPSPDVAALLNALLDIYERRDGAPKQAVRARLEQMVDQLPGYYSQVDPTPRVVANEQLLALEQHGLVHLAWQAWQAGHLLEAVTLEATQTPALYALL